MPRAWHLPRPLVGALILLLAGAPLRAQEKGHGEAEHAKPKYKAEIHEDGKEVPKDFDLSKPEDEEKLIEAVRHGHVEELRKDEPPTLQKLFSLSADLGIWSLVVFGLLFFVLSKIAWPKMIAGLKKREDNIHGALTDAQAARDEAKAIQADLQKQLASGNDQVRAMLDGARRDAQQLREAEMATTLAEIKAERDRLHREIEMQTAQAVQHIWAQAAELATLASAKALGRGITEPGHRKLIDEALAEIKASGGGANGHA